MENVSKALLIAGGILVTILVLSVGIYLYTIFLNQSKEYNAVISETELQKFNSKFDVYAERTDITVQEIVTAINLSKEYENVVEINVYDKNGIKIDLKKSEEFNSENLIKTFINSLFSCKEIGYDNEGKVNKLLFKEER